MRAVAGPAAYHGAATAVQTYALFLVQMTPYRDDQLERQHHIAIRLSKGLPHQSPVAGSPSLIMLWQALHHVNHLRRASGCAAFMRRLRSRPTSRMGQICALYEKLLPQSPCPILSLQSPSSPWTCSCSLKNSARGAHTGLRARSVRHREKIHDTLSGHLLVFTDGSVSNSSCLAVAVCVNKRLGRPSGAAFPSTQASLQQNWLDSLGSQPPSCHNTTAAHENLLQLLTSPTTAAAGRWRGDSCGTAARQAHRQRRAEASPVSERT
ncbi:hypothetical protein HPB52_009665 [Rhipicephalus sanguineus]|uniref:Uncharacterized protein n=1 Tax=Rhipicephalus sanguineus TaxID=34632 RepID=A0A9D4PL24_RHISA|nr:hypothetical protein HPB52_009665 [Rhipicephalus sanguineus]